MLTSALSPKNGPPGSGRNPEKKFRVVTRCATPVSECNLDAWSNNNEYDPSGSPHISPQFRRPDLRWRVRRPGRYWNIDPIILRVAFGVSLLVRGIGVFMYLAFWMLVPDDQAPPNVKYTPNWGCGSSDGRLR